MIKPSRFNFLRSEQLDTWKTTLNFSYVDDSPANFLGGYIICRLRLDDSSADPDSDDYCKSVLGMNVLRQSECADLPVNGTGPSLWS